jgi:hypothetical protein
MEDTNTGVERQVPNIIDCESMLLEPGFLDVAVGSIQQTRTEGVVATATTHFPSTPNNQPPETNIASMILYHYMI